MKLAVDENIVFAEKIFAPFGEVRLFNGREITREKIADCDALVVRSVTKVNAQLLEGTGIRFVGTATIGTDHIDTEYLKRRGIAFASAPGSNSNSVAEYVFAALFHLSEKFGFLLSEKSVGIIGAGNIGRKVEKFARALNMSVIKNDPPLQDAGEKGFSSLRDALSCDVVTFHVPFVRGGKYNTFHLLNAENIGLLSDGTVLINTSRGAVTDNAALNEFMKKKRILAVLDVWENEPAPLPDLIEKAEIATPHVAGYSFDGKINGAKMIFAALNEFFGTNYPWKEPFAKSEKIIDATALKSETEILAKAFKVAYPIEKESEEFKKRAANAENIAYEFDFMRKNYRKRFELSNYTVKINDRIDAKVLKAFGLKISPMGNRVGQTI